MIPVPRQIDAKGPDARPLIDVQAQHVATVDALNRIPLLDGRLLEGLELVAGVPLPIAHGLGRPFRGWFPVRLSYPGATAVVQEAATTTPSTTLRLQCAQACTLSLWVF